MPSSTYVDPSGERFTVVNSTVGMADELASVQRASFPTLSPLELITAEHYASHVEIFPEGQLAVLSAEGKVVACSTDLRTSRIDFDHFEHRYIDAVAGNWLTSHEPSGEWLYGADIGVTPAYRRRGIASELYRRRHELIRTLNLRGHVAGGLLSGFSSYKQELSVEQYVERVIAGDLIDPTLTVQLAAGFEVRGIIQHYVNDPKCDGRAAFLVWMNHHYRPLA
jgi:GNAT superfamily N-acetyltransferase